MIQVVTGTEDRVEEQIKKMIGNGLYESCFHPMRCVKKKFRGEWKEVHEKLLPGYVFVRSKCIQELYQEFKHIPMFTKLLGKEGEQFIPLPDYEVDWLEQIMVMSTQGIEVELSQISVLGDGEVTILSGSLKNIEGYIKKIDLHRRIAKVEVDFMNQKTIVYLGIEMVKKDEK